MKKENFLMKSENFIQSRSLETDFRRYVGMYISNIGGEKYVLVRGNLCIPN